MKTALIILTLLATALLPGCVVVPAHGGPYYGKPAVVGPPVVVRPYGGHHGGHYYRHHRHW